MNHAAPRWSELQGRLNLLIDSLKAAGFEVGTDQYLDANDLLLKRAAEGMPPSSRHLCYLLCGVFASTPDQQCEFRRLFQLWFAPAIRTYDSKEPETADGWWRLWDRLVRARWVFLAAFFGALVFPFVYERDPISPPVEIDIEPIIETPTDVKSNPNAPEPEYLPRPVPDQISIPAKYDQHWAKLSRLLWLIPVSLWLAWLFNQVYRRAVVATHEHSNNQRYDLSGIRLSGDYYRLFSDPSLDSIWRKLRQYRSNRGSELDINRTVEELVRKDGYLEPFYRDRSVPPAYLALIDRLHTEDHVAGLSGEWLDKLVRENIHVRRFYFRADPRFTRISEGSGFTSEPGALTAVYPDHDLLLLADGTALATGRTGEPQRWTSRLRNFYRVWLLTPQPLWPLASVYQKIQPLLRALPLTIGGLEQFDNKGDRLAQDSPLDIPLPALFAQDPTGWLQDFKRSGAENKALVDTLRRYLDAQGYLLLCATAAYPGVYWRLTRVLDQYLQLDDSHRIWRLRKLARLPWFRHGGFPLRIRITLLRSLAPDQLQQIQQILQQLQADAANNTVIQLPIHIPSLQQHRQRRARVDPGDQKLERSIDAAKSGDVLADPVFSQVIRGRKPRVHETELFDKVFNSPGHASIDYFFRAITVGLLILLLSFQGNVWLWENWLLPVSQQMAREDIRQDNRDVQVNIDVVPEMQAYANNLKSALNNYGYEDVSVQILASAAGTRSDSVSTDTSNTLRHNLNIDELNNIRYPIEFQLYGQLPITENEDPTLIASTVIVDLSTAISVFQDSLLEGSDVIEPRMTPIPAGCFLMGSPTDEIDRVNNEQQHRVCIENDFEMGVYEVTAAEYRQFARGTSLELTERQVALNDNQPIVDADWDDAMGFVNWLSNQTGRQYRLPTEAEWEYAARAMQDGDAITPFNTGNCISVEQANFDGGSQYADCPTSSDSPIQTVAVGQYPPNQWGLYDMHGNVWEWTCSTYDEGYQGGEAVCAAVGDEGRRVLRGGSWYAEPLRLRSAFRLIYGPTYRDISVGFRVARAIP